MKTVFNVLVLYGDYYFFCHFMVRLSYLYY